MPLKKNQNTPYTQILRTANALKKCNKTQNINCVVLKHEETNQFTGNVISSATRILVMVNPTAAMQAEAC